MTFAGHIVTGFLRKRPSINFAIEEVLRVKMSLFTKAELRPRLDQTIPSEAV